MELDRKQYNILKEKYGKVASWLIYYDDYGNHEKNYKLIERSIDILNPKYVFCGLNAACHTMKVWEAFHVKYQGGKGKLLRDTFNASRVFRGAYVTDIIKEHVDPKSNNVRDKIKKNGINIGHNIKIFCQEMDDLRVNGTYPIVYAFGWDAYNIIAQSDINKLYSVEYIVHYSMPGLSNEDFKLAIREKEKLIWKK